MNTYLFRYGKALDFMDLKLKSIFIFGTSWLQIWSPSTSSCPDWDDDNNNDGDDTKELSIDLHTCVCLCICITKINGHVSVGKDLHHHYIIVILTS